MSEAIKNKLSLLTVSDNLLKEVMARLDVAINKGLNKDTHSAAVVKCSPTYVQDLPEGTEIGKYLALDLGGTNFRVLMVNCEKKGCRLEFETYPISQSLMTGPGVKLFDYIAQCLSDFVKKKGVRNEQLDLGFTFSFPFNSVGLTEGIFLKWTKGFKCDGVEGKEIVNLLREALDRQHGLKISVVALLNDTTGCLVSCAYEHKYCRIGVIIGTGFNACYMEKSEKVTTFENVSGKPFVIVNTEWGAFGQEGELNFLLTEYDWAVDEKSLNPGAQIFEKMVSGMYMGELVRFIMEKLTREGLLFNGKGSKQLFTSGIITSNDISAVESSAKGNLNICTRLLSDRLGLPHATAQDCIDLHYICQVVSTRSAHLASAGIACLINRTKFNPITVGVDGSVYRFHSLYHDRMMAKIPTLLSSPRIFKLVLSQDGSGRGAAFVSAVAAREKKEAERKSAREAEDNVERAKRREEEEKFNKEQEEMRKEQHGVVEKENEQDVPNRKENGIQTEGNDGGFCTCSQSSDS